MKLSVVIPAYNEAESIVETLEKLYATLIQSNIPHEIVVVNDIWTQPLAAWDCARAIWKGLELNSKGTVNISGGTTLTLFELAQLTTKVFGLDEKLLKSAKSSDFENLAPRPMRTIFDLTRIKNEFNLKMSNPIEGLTELMRTESN